MLTLTVDTRGLKHHDAEQHTQQHDGDDGDDDDDATRGAEPANRTVYYRIASQSIFKVLFSDSEVQLCVFFFSLCCKPGPLSHTEHSFFTIWVKGTTSPAVFPWEPFFMAEWDHRCSAP